MDSSISLKGEESRLECLPRDGSTNSKFGNDSQCIITPENYAQEEVVGNNSLKKRCKDDSQDLPDEISDNNGEGEKSAKALWCEMSGNMLPDSGVNNSLSDEDIELPSTVFDRKQIFMPLDLRVDDPRIYGKWMWFTSGDLDRQDYVWIKLQALIFGGPVILIESSTARTCENRGKPQGIIRCYTRGDIETIKCAGLAIQDITKDNSILYYKTNQASKDSLNRTYGDRFITKYMLTASGKFYEKDELDRWKQIRNTYEKAVDPGKTRICFKNSVSEEDSLNFEENPVKRSVLQIHIPACKKELDSQLPSQECEKRRVFYPFRHSNMVEYDHLWTLFCNITDFDRNGMTELDRAWVEMKKLCDEGMFKAISSETYATFYRRPSDNQLRRSISCNLEGYYNLNKLIQSGDKIRERISYDFPMYMKMCTLTEDKQIRFKLKYMYTDDRDLYEYVDEEWRLIKRVW